MTFFRKWAAFLAKQRTRPEDSGLYRSSVVVLVTYAVLLTLHQMEWPEYWPLALAMTPAASWLSYRRRTSSNVGLKIFLSFAMVGLLFWFFGRLVASLTDPRLPLADLLIWLQVLHCFDLPAKKDLRYSVLVSLILMAIAAVLTYSRYFGIYLLGYCALLLWVALLDFWSEMRGKGVTVSGERGASEDRGLERPDGREIAWIVGTRLAVVLLVAGAIFSIMPRYRGLTLRTLPVSWNLQFNLGRVEKGQIVNPATSAGQSSDGRPQRFDGDTYFGFDSEVNLNSRGTLSDRIVLKVRTSHWQYHRGVTFAEYTGFGWNSGLSEPRVQTTHRPPFRYESYGGRGERLTIYYSEIDLPNVMFTPPAPNAIYYPSEELFVVDSFPYRQRIHSLVNTPAVIVSPSYLEEGLIYSVLNQVPDVAHDRFKSLPALREDASEWQYLRPYLQLPEELPERVGALARELVGDRTEPWVQASALSVHLQQNYLYNLEVDFYPEEADAVDYFLFESKEGYCEQFASALCVLARSVGIPARYVSGYLPGTYNPLSGFYEVRAKDAHAWAELYIPSYGWMIFDPVPGEDSTPELSEPPVSNWLLETLLEYLGAPLWLQERLPGLARWFLALAAAVLVLSLILERHRRRRGSAESRSELYPFLKEAERWTQPRRGWETVTEWSQRVGAPGLDRLAEIYAETFYRGRSLNSSHRVELQGLLRELKARGRAPSSDRGDF